MNRLRALLFISAAVVCFLPGTEAAVHPGIIPDEDYVRWINMYVEHNPHVAAQIMKMLSHGGDVLERLPHLLDNPLFVDLVDIMFDEVSKTNVSDVQKRPEYRDAMMKAMLARTIYLRILQRMLPHQSARDVLPYINDTLENEQCYNDTMDYMDSLNIPLPWAMKSALVFCGAVLGNASQVSSSCSSGVCSQCMNSGRIWDGAYFSSTSYMNLSHVELSHCAEQCLRRTECRSFNFNRQLQRCELLEKDSQALGRPIANANWIFSDISTWPKRIIGACADISCRENSMCQYGVNSTVFCSLTECSNIMVEVNNASVIYMDRSLGGMATYACQEGFGLVGNSTVTCENDGNWTLPDFHCRASCDISSGFAFHEESGLCYKWNQTYVTNHIGCVDACSAVGGRLAIADTDLKATFLLDLFNSTSVYVGCFTDSNTRQLPDLRYDNDAMTPEMCIVYCRDHGHPLAGVEVGRVCFCGNSYDANLATTGCSTPCGGNITEVCGDTWKISIYRTDECAHIDGSGGATKGILWDPSQPDGNTTEPYIAYHKNGRHGWSDIASTVNCTCMCDRALW